MKRTEIFKKLSRINREIGNTPVHHDGRYQQLVKEKEQLEQSFYREYNGK